MKTKIQIFIGIILISIGIIFFVLVSSQKDNKMKRCTETTTAMAVNVDVDYDDDGAEYEVTVRFDANGEDKEYTATTSTEYREGDKFTAHYNPENPDEFYVDDLSDTPFMIKIAGITVAFIGVILIITTIFPYIKKTNN